MSFTVVDLKQGSQEWLSWRNEGIGASDAPSIIGENPYKTAEEVLRDKTGRRSSVEQNSFMATGTALEPLAREHYCSQTGLRMLPVCVQSTRHTWLKASLDGMTEDRAQVIEIKCGKSAYRQTQMSGKPPRYYFGQLQHILAVTGLPQIDFLCFYPPYQPLCITVPRNDAYICNLLTAEAEFWERVLAVRV
jgi:putative phage-type endonuclease